jgi:hypothetical protein
VHLVGFIIRNSSALRLTNAIRHREDSAILEITETGRQLSLCFDSCVVEAVISPIVHLLCNCRVL